MVCRCWFGGGSFIPKYYTHASTHTYVGAWKLVKSAYDIIARTCTYTHAYTCTHTHTYMIQYFCYVVIEQTGKIFISLSYALLVEHFTIVSSGVYDCMVHVPHSH